MPTPVASESTPCLCHSPREDTRTFLSATQVCTDEPSADGALWERARLLVCYDDHALVPHEFRGNMATNETGTSEDETHNALGRKRR